AASSFPTYIDRVVRADLVRFSKLGHGEVFIGGHRYVHLEEPLHDEDLKPISTWIDRHNKYAAAEAKMDLEVLSGNFHVGHWRWWRTRLRQFPGWPVAFLFYLLVFRGGILEGPRGWTYCAMKAMYEYFVQLHARDQRMRGEVRSCRY